MRLSFLFLLVLCVQVLSAQSPAQLSTRDIGLVNISVEFKRTDSTFSIRTRAGAADELLGKGTATLARWATPHFDEGRVLRVVGGTITRRNDSTLYRGVLTAPFGNYHFIGLERNDSLIAQLTNGKHQLRGSFRLSFENPPPPPTDFSPIVTAALDSAAQYLYDPALLRSAKWKRFAKKIRRTGPLCQDELELVIAFFHRAGKLPFSHFALMRPATIGNEVALPSARFALRDTLGSTGIITVTDLGGPAAEVDSIFALVAAKNYTHLVLDLRGVPGGNVEAGIRLAAHLVSDTLEGGYFLTRRWWDAQGRLPTRAEVRALPAFSEANYDAIIAGIHRELGLRLVVHPVATPYRGRLTVLTDGRTASTCEPLVHGLKASGRATIVGETTAGAMLNAEPFMLWYGLTLYLPTADFRTMDGVVLDGRGVKPDVRAKSKEALSKALR